MRWRFECVEPQGSRRKCGEWSRRADRRGWEKGTIGFPYEPDEVAHFAKMLEKCKRNLTGADVKTLTASLDAIRAADEAKKAEAEKLKAQKAGESGQ
jgi:hypothetical protein